MRQAPAWVPRSWICSAAREWIPDGSSWATPGTARTLEQAGLTQAELRKLVTDNPQTFFAQ